MEGVQARVVQCHVIEYSTYYSFDEFMKYLSGRGVERKKAEEVWQKMEKVFDSEGQCKARMVHRDVVR